MNKQRYAIGLLAASLCLPLIASANGQPAEPTTVEANAAVLQQLDFSDRKAFEDARRGFIAARQTARYATRMAAPPGI